MNEPHCTTCRSCIRLEHTEHGAAPGQTEWRLFCNDPVVKVGNLTTGEEAKTCSRYEFGEPTVERLPQKFAAAAGGESEEKRLPAIKPPFPPGLPGN